MEEIFVLTHISDRDGVFEHTYEAVLVRINEYEGVNDGDNVIEYNGEAGFDKVSTFDDVTEGDNVCEFTSVEEYVWTIMNDGDNAFSFIIISVHGNVILLDLNKGDDVDAVVQEFVASGAIVLDFDSA